MKLKIVVLGDRAAGKTSLIQRYVFNSFSDVYQGTLGAKLHLLEFTKEISGQDIVEADIGLFDLMGEHGARDHFRDALFWGAHGFIAVCDVTRPETFDSLSEWIAIVGDVAGNVPYRILFNKADLLPRPVLDADLMRKLQTFYPAVPYSLVSAKTGGEVERAITMFLEDVVDSLLERSRERRAGRIVGNRILSFALKRGRTGVTKNELLGAFKTLDYNSLMQEVEDLERTGLVVREEMGPANFRILITAAGEEAATKLGMHEYIVDEVT